MNCLPEATCLYHIVLCEFLWGGRQHPGLHKPTAKVDRPAQPFELLFGATRTQCGQEIQSSPIARKTETVLFAHVTSLTGCHAGGNVLLFVTT